MTSGSIQHIVCAVRGGAESQHTVDSAIDLAQRAGARLSLVHVVDPGCIDCGDLAKSSAAYRQYMGEAESNMQTLRRQARAAGITEVDLELREGDTRQELRQLVLDTDAEIFVLGRPGPDLERNVFGIEEFHQFMAELDFGGDLRTIQVRPLPDVGQEARDSSGGPDHEKLM